MNIVTTTINLFYKLEIKKVFRKSWLSKKAFTFIQQLLLYYFFSIFKAFYSRNYAKLNDRNKN